MTKEKNGLFFVYMNAYTEVFDPHTNYFFTQDKEDFDVSFKGSVIELEQPFKRKKEK